jgi:hypothetical protein
MPSVVAWPASLATLIRNWTQTSMDTTTHSHRQPKWIAVSIRPSYGCAFGSVKCAYRYRNAGRAIAVFAHLVTQITFFAATISLSVHQLALSEQTVAASRGLGNTGAGRGA